VIDVHLIGAFYWLQATRRHMVQRAKKDDKIGRSIVWRGVERKQFSQGVIGPLS
jgi:hypothetical protein